MRFDEQGHIQLTPKELYQLASEDPRRLINFYLMHGTPMAFELYASYVEFLEAISERTGVHPKNLYLRGSCQVGFSIAPRSYKVWTRMHDRSDLDLVIVDGPYFERYEHEVRRWEARNPLESLQGKASKDFMDRRRDRQYNCCRDTSFPSVVGMHHCDTMASVAKMKHCGRDRGLNAFIYPDWHSARERYEFDIRKLRDEIDGGRLRPPGDLPLPAGA